jgi:hypothetical protein
MPRAVRYRFSLYILINVAFALLVGVAYAAGGFPNPRLLHLILLFALCSTTVIDLDSLNGRYALMALFMLVYFVSYGVGDLSNLLTGNDLSGASWYPRDSDLISKPEVAIFVGGIMWVVGSRMALFMVSARRSADSPRDWSKRTVLIVGLTFWAIGTFATYRWNIYIVPDTTNEAVRKGLASLSPLVTLLYLLGQMFQPLGILLLAYAFRVSRSPFLLVLVIAIVIVQIFIGFVSDIKGLAMLGMILVIVTSVLVDGRLPKSWLVAGVMFVTLLYPYFTAYRGAIHGAGIARTTVVENFGRILQLTSAAKDKVNTGRERAQTFLERSSVKGSIEVIVEKTGNGVAFQRGHTLAPILTTFMPRIVWSEKLGVPTGQLMNKAFHIADNDDVYISPSHMGELYWNFGWPGLVAGMGLIGLICGYVGAEFNLAEYRTVTRILVTVITIKQLIVSFESTIADCYVTWLRSLAGVGILHLIFARVPVVSRLFRTTTSESESTESELAESELGPSDGLPGNRLFPNLLT